MKKLWLIIALSAHALCICAQGKIAAENVEFSFVSGYHQPLGSLGIKFGYRPNIFKHMLQFNGGIGSGRVQSLRLSLGLNFYPLKEWWVTPYCGADYSFALGASLGNESGTELYDVGIHHYVSPYAAIRIKSWTHTLNFKLKFGYSNLLNRPNIKVNGVLGPDYQVLLDKIQSHWMFVVGICIRSFQ